MGNTAAINPLSSNPIPMLAHAAYAQRAGAYQSRALLTVVYLVGR